MNTGTAGPWIVERHGTSYPDLFTYDVIAPAGYTNRDGEVRRCSVSCGLDSEADARLIAAAPALLEALEELLEEMPTQWEMDIPMPAEAVGKARRAIAQAKGEA